MWKQYKYEKNEDTELMELYHRKDGSHSDQFPIHNIHTFIWCENINAFYCNFDIKNNPSIMLLGQSSQLKIFYEALKELKQDKKMI